MSHPETPRGVIRIPRWTLPVSATGFTLAAIITLVASEAENPVEFAPLPAVADANVSLGGPASDREEPAAPLENPATLGYVGALTAPVEPAPGTPITGGAGFVENPVYATCKKRERARPRRDLDAAALLAKAGSDLAALREASSLPDRFKVLNEIARRAPDEAAPALEGLLGSELPGNLYEAETLRLALLGKLGQLPGARADALLVAALDAARPRPERLVALEALASRPNVGRAEVGAVALGDHDPVVQDRARALVAKERS